MELRVKQGYVLVSFVKGVDYQLGEGWNAAKIEAGNPADVGIVVFFKEWCWFNYDLALVKIDDVVAWIKPEGKEEVITEVVVDESKNDQA